jgi:Tol biopolymer transport system component
MPTPDHWRRVEELYHAACARDAGQRAAFLADACAGDEALRREVESLLAQPASAQGFLNGPAIAAVQIDEERSTSEFIGRRIGAYQVQALIGAGGMGHVYCARDTKLGRDVAIKILPRAFTSDPERRARIEREARVLAALNHPNIATIYGIEDFEGMPALVLELITGETLAERIARGPLSLSEILAIGRQIADGLQAAHEGGILHRDLKPANLYLTSHGRVKILDFGIAKYSETDVTAAQHETAETSANQRLNTLATAPGGFLGTPAYSSPEQISGDEVDQRSDLFALGLVLYEMASRRLPYPGTSLAQMLAGAVAVPIDPPSRLKPGLPSAVDALVLRLVQKEPGKRFQSAAEVSAALLKLAQPSRLPSYGGVGVGVFVVLVAAAIASRVGLGRVNPPRTAEYVRLTNFPDAVHSPALSKDGKTLLFVRGSEPFQFGPGELYVKALPDGEPVALTHDGTTKIAPTVSPDGSRAVYTTFTGAGWTSMSVSIGGGRPTLLMRNAAALTWTSANRVMFSEMRDRTSLHMAVVTATENGGESRNVYVPASSTQMAHYSELSPDGHWVLVVEMDMTGWLPCRLVPSDGSSGGTSVGPPGASCTASAWSPDGRWMYLVVAAAGESHIWRQRFPDGAPEQLTFGVTEERDVVADPDGRSVITSIGAMHGTVWYHDQTGDRPLSVEGYAYKPLVSPDGTKVFYLVRRAAKDSFWIGELWSTELTSGRRERVVPELLIRHFDVAKDGRHVVFDTFNAWGRSEIWLAALDRSDRPKRLSPDKQVGEEHPVFGTSGRIYSISPWCLRRFRVSTATCTRSACAAAWFVGSP